MISTSAGMRTTSSGGSTSGGLRTDEAFGVVGSHETLDHGVQLVPWRIDEIVVAHSECRTDEEFLVRRGPARVIRADEVPGKFEQLHAVDGGELAGSPERLEQVAQLRILDHVDACRKLELPASHELAQDVDQLAMVLHRPMDGGIEIAPVEDDKSIIERLEGLDLTIDHGAVARLHGGKPRERVAHRRDVTRPGEAGDEARDADEKPQLRGEAHVRLMV